MKVLIVDDSSTIRLILRRALVETGGVEVSEATNGIEALDEIARQHFQLVILDVNMPVMDGVETLEAIRSSPVHTGLPVIMLTGEKNEAIVRRLVELGITDFLSKPLSKTQMAERLARVIARVVEPPAQTPGALPAAHGPRVLVVERDADFRQFLTSTLSPHFTTLVADSGAAALKLCLDPAQGQCDLILAGNNIDPPSLEIFAAKIKSFSHLTGTRLVAMLPKAEPKSDRLRQLCFGFLDRTYVQDVLIAQLHSLIGGAETAARNKPLLRPSLQKDTVAAAEQVFGMMLSLDIEACSADQASALALSKHGVRASISLAVEDEGFKLELMMRTAVESARIIAAKMIGVSPSDVNEADVLSSVAEIVNIIGGRLRNRLVETSPRTVLGLPSVSVGAAPVSTLAAAGTEAIVMSFRAPQQQFALELTLTASAAGTVRHATTA